MGPRASVVVVTTVNATGLERGLAALAALRDQPAFETIVVLNGAEEPVREAAARAGGVKLVESVVNRGLAAGAIPGVAFGRYGQMFDDVVNEDVPDEFLDGTG